MKITDPRHPAYRPNRIGHGGPPKAEPLNVDWEDPDAIWVYKRELFKNFQVEVGPAQFVPYNPHVGQLPIHLPKQGEEWKVFVASAGQRSGKTLAAAAEVIARLGMPGQRIWIVAPTYDLCKRCFEQVWETVCQKEIHGARSVRKKGTSNAKSESMQITMKWGSWVRCKSAENPDSLVGEKLTFVVLDEAAQCPEEIWTQHLVQRLVNYKGDALIITSPRGENWVYEYYLRGQDPELQKEGWRSTKFRTHDNPFVDDAWLERQRKLMPANAFAQEYLGEFVTFAGKIYGDFRDLLTSEGGHIYDPDKFPIRPEWTHYRGIDVGLEHSTACLWAQVDTKGNVWIYREYLGGGKTHQYHARRIKALTTHDIQQSWISPDARRRSRLRDNEQASSESAQDVYAEEGVYNYPAANDVNDGIALVRAYMLATLHDSTTHPRLYVSRECPELREGILKYQWQGQRLQRDDMRKDQPEKPRKYQDDMVDALRYLLMGRPTYIPYTAQHYTETDDFDPAREGWKVGQREDGYSRPGVEYG